MADKHTTTFANTCPKCGRTHQVKTKNNCNGKHICSKCKSQTYRERNPERVRELRNARYYTDVEATRAKNRVKREQWKEKNRDHYLKQKQLQSNRARARKAGMTLDEYLLRQKEREEQRSIKLQPIEPTIEELIERALIKIDKKSQVQKVRCRVLKCLDNKTASRILYHVNAEANRQKQRLYYQQNTERERLRVSNKKHNNRALRRNQSTRRNSLIKQLKEYKLTTEQWNAIKEYFGYRCAYCLKQSDRLTIDHVIPLYMGGTHDIENIVPACRSCNSSKGAKALPLWLHDKNCHRQATLRRFPKNGSLATATYL